MAPDCAPFGVYSWNNVAAQIDGRQLVGLWEGDDVFVIEPTTELGKPVVGADGSSIVSITADLAHDDVEDILEGRAKIAEFDFNEPTKGQVETWERDGWETGPRLVEFETRTIVFLVN